ncbi:MAG: Gldg family protein [Planctomycetota bacterium]
MKGSIASVVLGGLLVAANLIVANLLLRKVDFRRDLTADRRFEIGEGTNSVLDRLSDTVSIRCYFSSNLPKRYQHCDRIVLEKLQEYEKASDGKVVYEFVDPETDEAVKQEADDLGIIAARTTEFESATSQREVICYMAMVFRFADRKVVLNLFQDMQQNLEDRARFLSDLEYQLTRNIIAVTTRRRTIGILADTEKVPVNPQNPRGEKRSYQGLANLRGLLERSYDVLPALDVAEINRGADLPEGIDVLVVHGPSELSEIGLYQIDQFMMRGGNVLFTVDAGTIEDQLKPVKRNYGRQEVQDFELPTWKGVVVDHGLDPLLAHLGVRVEKEFVEDRSAFRYVFVHDRTLQRDQIGRIGVVPETRDGPLLAWVEAPARDADGHPIDAAGQIGEGQAIVTDRDTVVLAGVSPITLLDERLREIGATARVILRSGPESGVRPIKDGIFSPDPRVALPLVPGERSNLMVSLSGRFPSLFAGRDIPSVTGANGDPLPVPEARIAARRTEPVRPNLVIVLSDADGLSDRRLSDVLRMDQYVNKITNQALLRKKASGIVRMAANAVDLLAYGDEAGALFDVKSRREVHAREIRKVEEGDDDKRLVDWVIFGIIPGFVFLAGVARWLFRRLFAVAS